MKILYVTQHFPPETGAAQSRAYETAKQLVKLGNEVTVITGFPNYPTGIIPDEYRKKLFQTEIIDGIKVKRTFIIPDTKVSTKRRLANYLSFMISSIFRGLYFSKYDIVYATSPQLFVGISGYILSKLHRSKFVFEVRDLWVDFAYELGQLKSKRILKIAKRIEGFLYKKADLIVTVTNGYRDRLISKGIDARKIKVITNGVDTLYYQPKDNNDSLRIEYNLVDKFVVLFAGNVGGAQGLDVVVQAANILKDDSDIIFMIIGDGVEKQRLIKISEEKKLKNIKFVENQPQDKIVDFHNMADASLVSLKKFDLFNITIPSKTFDTLAVGKPVLIGVDGEARNIIEEAEAGLFFEPENASQLAQHVVRLKDNKNLCKTMGKNARNAAVNKYQRHILVSRLELCLENLLT